MTLASAAFRGVQGAASSHGQTTNAETTVVAEYRGFLDSYCVRCHNERLATAGLAFDKMDVSRPGAAADVWEKVVLKLRTGQMPPPGMRRPDKAAYDSFASWLEGELDRAAKTNPNPGRPTLRRINRAEYTNA